MLIDAHVHVWDLGRNPYGVDYPWLTSDLPPLFRTYTLTEIRTEMDASGVCGVVLVQASDSTAETDALLSAAEGRQILTGRSGSSAGSHWPTRRPARTSRPDCPGASNWSASAI